jgi:hypothetical protein
VSATSISFAVTGSDPKSRNWNDSRMQKVS